MSNTIEMKAYYMKYLTFLIAVVITINVVLICFTNFHQTKRSEADSDKLFLSLLCRRAKDRYYSIPHSTPVSDATEKYKYHTFVFRGSSWALAENASKPSVCLATHATVDRLFWLANQSLTWDGLISVSVYIPGADSSVADVMFKYLRRCSHYMSQMVSVHFVYPVSDAALIPDNFSLPDETSCTEAERVNMIFTRYLDIRDRYSRNNYPQNLMRNVARISCPTTHSVSVDIDMIPSRSLASHLQTFINSTDLCQKCAYVIPVYEIDSKAQFPPSSKEMLLAMLKNKQARRFHDKVYTTNQRNTELQKWESTAVTPNSTQIKVLYDVTMYEEGWEPIAVIHSSAPNFDERFVGYGYTRSSHIYLLHVLKYSFHVLENAFFSHRGFQTADNYPSYRHTQLKVNAHIYSAYKRELLLRSRYSPVRQRFLPERKYRLKKPSRL